MRVRTLDGELDQIENPVPPTHNTWASAPSSYAPAVHAGQDDGGINIPGLGPVSGIELIGLSLAGFGLLWLLLKD